MTKADEHTELRPKVANGGEEIQELKMIRNMQLRALKSTQR